MGALLFLLHTAVTTLTTARDAIVASVFWRLNICGAFEIVVWFHRTRKYLVINHAKLPEIVY